MVLHGTAPTPVEGAATPGLRAASGHEAAAKSGHPMHALVPAWLRDTFTAQPTYAEPADFGWNEPKTSQQYNSASNCWVRPRITPHVDVRSACEWFVVQKVGEEHTMPDRALWAEAKCTQGQLGSTAVSSRIPFAPAPGRGPRTTQLDGSHAKHWTAWKGAANAWGKEEVGFNELVTVVRGLDLALPPLCSVGHGVRRVPRC